MNAVTHMPLQFAAIMLMSLQSGAVYAAAAQPAASADDSASADAPQIGDIVVTANKREQNIRDVGMSIQTATGATLTTLGISDPSQLTKIAPGFNSNPTTHDNKQNYGIRGISFQDSALADSPTVTVYVDQVPLPFASMGAGAILDLERVEVLKGPQGTIFGENATGGAINFIANKPTDTLRLGGDVSYGRFNTVDAQGYVSGPVTDTLSARLAARTIQSGPWQQSYTRDASSGRKNLTSGRFTLLWKPNSKLTVDTVLEGFIDKSEAQQPQLFGFAPNGNADPRLIGTGPYLNAPFINQGKAGHYPFGPASDRAADWSPCVNTSPSDPPFNTQTAPYGFPRPANGTACTGYRADNKQYRASVRIDYDAFDDITLTSLSSYIHFKEYEPVDTAGVFYQINQSITSGFLETAYQEFRAAGKFAGKGNWIVGGNLERDKSHEAIFVSLGDAAISPVLGAYPVYTSEPVANLRSTIAAVFANGDYPITERLSLTAGVRYTDDDIRFRGCTYDGGDGSFANALFALQKIAEGRGGTPGTAVYPGIGGCTTLGPPPTYNPAPDGFTSRLHEHNVSWKAGLNWKVDGSNLLYATVSKGYKAGGYPNTGATTYAQFTPTKQENVLAFEAGEKASLFNKSLLIDAAGYYYRYQGKQILGNRVDPVLGPIATLVNVPNSRIYGFEASAIWRPVGGITLKPAVNYTHSEIRHCSASDNPADANIAGGPGCYGGDYHNYDAFGQLGDLTGESLPYTPKWQASADAQYHWRVTDRVGAFAGVNVNVQSASHGGFIVYTNPTQPSDILRIPSRTLVDLRAGLTKGAWGLQVWGRNVFNTYYWTTAIKTQDVLFHRTGMPATYGLTLSWHD